MRLENDDDKEEEGLKDDEDNDLRGTMGTSEGCHQSFDDHEEEEGYNIVYPIGAIGSGERGYPIRCVDAMPFALGRRRAEGEECGRKYSHREGNEKKDG